MRSLHVINGLGAGGAERSLAEFLPELPTHGIEPTVAVFYSRLEGVEQDVVAAGIPVVKAPRSGWVAWVRWLRSLIREFDINVVHSTIAEADMAARLASRGGPPLLTSLVSTPYTPERMLAGGIPAWKINAHRAVERASAPRLTTHFHAISRAVADHSVQHLGLAPTDVTVVPRGRRADRLGWPDPERRMRVRTGLGVGDSTPLVLNVGRREPAKGQIHLIRALAALRDRGLDVMCIIAGRDGTSSKQLETLTRQLQLEDRVRFLGHREDIPDLQDAADIFAFPSMYEGLGGALLEAMALKTPIVASDVPAIREVLADGSCGHLVPPGDHMSLATAIEHLVHHDSAELVRRAESRFRQVYTHEKVARAMAELLSRVGASAPRS